MRILCTALFFLALSLSSSLHAQEIFVNITGPDGQIIKGESMNESFREQIESLSFAQASSSNCSSSSSGTGGCGATTGNFFMVVNFDKSLNALRRAMYRGEFLRNVDVTFSKTSGTMKPTTYYTIHMELVQVASISDAKSGTDRNTVQVELNPAKFGWTYYPADRTTPVKFGWDRTANQEWTGF